MPPLKNQRHEKFCQIVAQGDVSGTEAYRRIYPTTVDSSARASAAKLLAKGNIQARLSELKEIASEKTSMGLAEKIERLLEIFLCRPDDIDGSSPICQGIRYTKDGTPYYVIPDKLAALRLASQLAGELTEKKEVAVTGLATPVELEERVKAASVLLSDR